MTYDGFWDDMIVDDETEEETPFPRFSLMTLFCRVMTVLCGNSSAISTYSPKWQIVNFDKEINACYIAIRVIDSTAYNEDQVGVRIEEFGLYGEEADIDYQPTNLASYLPVSAYITDANGKTEAVSDKDFTIKENIYISDSDASTVADFTTDGKKLDLVFNLCNDAELSAIKVLAENSKLSYNVYAAMDIGKAWDNSSLIATYNGSDTPFSVGEDEYWSTIGELENFPTDEEEKEEEKTEDSSNDLDLEDGSDFLGDQEFEEGETISSKTKTTKRIIKTVAPLWLLILEGAVVLLFLGAIVSIIVLQVIKNKNKKVI